MRARRDENNQAPPIGSLGYVPDVPYLYDKLSGVEFLQFIADMYGLDHRELRATHRGADRRLSACTISSTT